MRIETIEQKAAVFPSNSMYIYGSTLKEWAMRDGKTVTHTTDGTPIFDREIYEVNSAGIFVVE